MNFILPAEWSSQDAIMFTWPHEQTDWSEILNKVEPVYLTLCQHILTQQQLVIVAHDRALKQHIISLFKTAGLALNKTHFIISPCNDTWARDHGPITLVAKHGATESEPTAQIKTLDFTFNGWGNKYASTLDNKINQQVFTHKLNTNALSEQIDFVLEGGAIETDGKGTLLTTKNCLLNPNRNPGQDQQQIEAQLSKTLGFDHYLWLEHGFLTGDDTDSHIDTLVRFAPQDTLVYVSCDDKTDLHYTALAKMADELRAFRNKQDKAYKLIPLPWPVAKYNQGERLPASYANYLIINNLVLVPTYQDEQDALALAQIQKAYPEHEIIPVDCLPLIQQFGSLHCISMQLPAGFLK